MPEQTTYREQRGGLAAIMRRSVLEIVRRPIYWIGFFFLPLFGFLFMTDLMADGLPLRAPAAIVDNDHTEMSRSITQQLDGMQLVSIDYAAESYSAARHDMQEGKIYGFFLIPHNFQADLLAGRKPEITFYTNMTYYVPGELLYKTFMTTAVYTKAGVTSTLLSSVGVAGDEITPLLQPVKINARPIGNPWLNYSIYLCNSFMPAILELMIFLITVFSIGQEIKYGRSVELMAMARSSITRALIGKLLPQTLIWIAVALFMQSWLFYWNGFPMHCPWWRMALSEVMFVLACQGFGVFVMSVMPNLRLALSICSLTGILAFSIAAFSFPVESMYPSIGIFSWILPTRYNFLIYIDQALNGRELYYSRIWYAAYIVFMLLPFTMGWRLKRYMLRPVYTP